MYAFHALALTALLATGCATSPGLRFYPGEARPAESVAQIDVAPEFEVKTVDGQKTGDGFFGKASGTVLEVLPGHHELVARFYSPFENGTTGVNSSFDKPDRSNYQTLSLDAVAGRRYALQRSTVQGQVVLSLAESGQTANLDARPVTPTRIASKPAEPTPAAIESVPAVAAAAPTKPTVEAPKITPLDNLKQWWYYASPAERAQFRQWMETNQ